MQDEEKMNAYLHKAQQDPPAKQLFPIVYAFLTLQITDESTLPVIYSQNILKKIVYSRVSCDYTEFSSTFSTQFSYQFVGERRFN